MGYAGAWLTPHDGDGRDVTAGIPELEDEHASLFGVVTADMGSSRQKQGSRQPSEVSSRPADGGHRKTDGAESLVDTSIRRRPFDDAEVTEVKVQV